MLTCQCSVGRAEVDDGREGDDSGGRHGGARAGGLRPEEVAMLREVQGTELNFIGFGKLLGLWSSMSGQRH